MGDNATFAVSIATTNNQNGIVRFNGDNSTFGSNNVFELNTGNTVRIGNLGTDPGTGERVTVRGGMLILTSNAVNATVPGNNFSDFGADVFASDGATIRFHYPNGNGGSATFQAGKIYLDNGSLQVSRNTTSGTFTFNREIFASGNSLVMGSRNEGGGGGSSTNWQFGTLNMDAGTVLTTRTSAASGNAPEISFIGDLNWKGAVGLTPMMGTEDSHVTNLPGTWNRGTQATIAFDNTNAAASYATTATDIATNGVIGYATYNDNFAQLNAGAITELTTYSALSSGSLTATGNYEATDSVTIDAGEIVNALKINNTAGSGTLDLSAGTLDIQSGGVLFTGTSDYTIQNGQLGADDTEVIFHQRGASALTVDAAISGGTGSLTQTGVGTLVISAPQTFSGRTMVNQGTLELSGAGSLASERITLHAAGILDLSTVSGASYTLGAAQVLDGSGTVFLGGTSLTLSGTVNPGFSAGTLSFENGDVILDGVLNMEIFGFGSGQYDQLTLEGGTLTAGGTLNLLNLFDEPISADSLGMMVKLFDVSNDSFASSFGEITGLDLANGYSWDTSNLLTDGTLTVVPEPQTYALLFGLLGLGLALRRRTRRA